MVDKYFDELLNLQQIQSGRGLINGEPVGIFFDLIS